MISRIAQNRHYLRMYRLTVVGIVFGVIFYASTVQAQTTRRISVTSEGVESDGESFITAISGDGRYVVFSSFSTNLVPGGTNGWLQVLRHDSQTGEIIDTSLDYLGNQALYYSWFATVSSDGNRVAFTSNSTSLVPDGIDDYFQAYVRDVSAGVTLLASSSAGGEMGNENSYFSAISGNGRYVGFSSYATNLVPDSGEVEQCYRKDLQTGEIIIASRNSVGELGNGDSGEAVLSYDGRYAVFPSDATNLVPNDTNNKTDIFVRDTLTGTTERVSVSSTGGQSNGSCDWPTISGDGRYVAFECNASNLVEPNTAVGRTNVYVFDRLTDTIKIVSVDSDGMYGNAASSGGVMSENGKYVVFNSEATNLVDVPVVAKTQVYSHNLASGRTIIVSVNDNGDPANANSDWQSVSGDGRVVAFASDATNLIPNDTNNERDIYVRELGPPFNTIASINCGGPAVGSWVADRYYQGGRVLYTSSTITNIGTVPMLVYQTQRSGRFEYTIPNLVVGSYALKLYFAETVFSKAGARIFNVSVNGSTVLNRYDIYAAAGGKNKAVVVSIPITVSGSTMKITFTPVKTDAIVSGIEVQKLFE